MDENVALLDPPALPVEPAGEKKIVVRKKRAPTHDFKDGNGRVFAHRHDNGKGWIADTANVADTCYVGPRCEVFNFARLTGLVRMEGVARVYGHALLQGNISMNKAAQVYGRATVRDDVQLHDNATVFDHAVVSGNSRVFGQSSVYGSAQVVGTHLATNARVSGSATVVRSHLTGDIYLRQNCVAVHATMSGKVTVSDFAQIVHSALSTYSSSSLAVLVCGYAVVADQSQITSPMEIKGHSVVVRSAFRGMYPETGRALFALNGNMVVSNRQFYDRAQADEFLELMTRTNNGQNVPPSIAVQSAARPAVICAPSTRRVMRLEEVAL